MNRAAQQHWDSHGVLILKAWVVKQLLLFMAQAEDCYTYMYIYTRIYTYIYIYIYICKCSFCRCSFFGWGGVLT